MNDYSEYVELLRGRLREKRFQHSLNVADKAKELAGMFGENTEKAYLAGLLHDVCKNDSEEKQLQIFREFGIILDNVQKTQKKLWHQLSGAAYVEHILGIKDKDIISAISCHTTGKKNMNRLDKIIYLADYISVERSFDGVNFLRGSLPKGLDYTMLHALKMSVSNLCSRELPIHPDTINAYNQMTAYSDKKR